MKRKLIDYAVFQKMRETSLSTAVKELVEAEDHLANVLGTDLTLTSFDGDTVVYETADGTYIKANYSIDGESIKFEGVEELVIDEQTERKQARSLIGDMLEAILDDNETIADQLFNEYMKISSQKHVRESAINEETRVRQYWRGNKPKISKQVGSKNPNRVRAGKNQSRSSRLKAGRKKHSNSAKNKFHLNALKRNHPKLAIASGHKQYTGKRKMHEWLGIANNVFGYLDYVDNGHVVSESIIADDGTLNVTVPTEKTRNEGKILKMQFDLMKTDFKVLRENARRLASDPRFCSAVAEIKRYNNLADNNELEETIGNLVTTFPSVLYLSEEELSQVIGAALAAHGTTNYDDQTCAFMAEGILRVAHNAFSDRVGRIIQAAGKPELKEGDSYQHFQAVVRDFFPTLDESVGSEMRMFEDLRNAMLDVRRLALDAGNEVVRNEASSYLEELEEILDGRQMPSLQLAAEAAEWLYAFAETNLESGAWSVVKTPHKTVTGDHPQMGKNAQKPYKPSTDFSGDWGDPAPMISGDKEGYKGGAPDEARSHSWGNKGGKDTFPSLNNPYVPKPFGDYTMKGEKGVDKDTDGLDTWQSSDTFPGLTNPYVPKAVIPHQKVQPDNSVE